MGDISAFVLAIGAVLIGLGLLLGWINYKIDKLKEENKLNIDMIGSIIALEKAVKKLNEALKTHEQRLDILEADHPDTDIDYGEVDDDANVIAVWFNGKKYVPEDKKDENTSTFYADNKVVAETHCCATCQHYRPDSGYSTCDFRTWLHATKKYATMADSVCNNYEKTSAVLVPSDKGKVEYICGIYDDRVSADEFNERIHSAFLRSGIMSMREWREFMEDLNSDT